MATTLHRMSKGRFALGLGRGFDALFDLMGLPRITNAQLRDAIAVQRRLWAGERFDHAGPSGTYPYLFLMDEEIDGGDPGPDGGARPEGAGAGRRGRRRGRAAHLHDRRGGRAERGGGTGPAPRQAGKDPAALRVWACTAVVEESLPHEVVLKKTVGRLATYLQGYGDLLVRINEWDPAALQRFREDELVAGFQGAFDAVATPDQLEYLAEKVIPQDWLDCAITGSGASCAQQVAGSFASDRGRQRDPARLDAGRSWRRSSRRTATPSRRPARAAGEPRADGVTATPRSRQPVAAVEDLTAAWLTAAALGSRCRRGHRHDRSGPARWAPATGSTCTGDRDLPATLLAKLPTADPAAREFLHGLVPHRGHVLPRPAPTVAVRRSACHYAAISDDPAQRGTFTLLLEDLAPAVQGDQIRRLHAGRRRWLRRERRRAARAAVVRPVALDIAGLTLDDPGGRGHAGRGVRATRSRVVLQRLDGLVSRRRCGAAARGRAVRRALVTRPLRSGSDPCTATTGSTT